jgi:hypothetical protein
MPAWHDTDFYIGAQGLGVWTSVLLAVTFGILLYPGLFVCAVVSAVDALKHVRRALAVEASARARDLRPGPTIVHGVVTENLEAPPAADVPIRPTASRHAGPREEQDAWTETSREVKLRPFAMRHDGGAVIRVEPGEEALLADDLSLTADTHLVGLTRVAEMRVGASVYVDGILVPPAPGDGAYRGGEASFTMQPPARGCVRVSREPRDRPHEVRARIHGKWAVGLTAALVFIDGVCFGSYFRGRAMGYVEEGRVTDVSTWTTTEKHGFPRRWGPVDHWGVSAVIGDRAQPSGRVEVSEAAYREATAVRAQGGVATLPFVVVAGSHTLWVGQEPTAPLLLSELLPTFLFVAGFLVPLFYAASVKRARPGFMRSAVIEGARVD